MRAITRKHLDQRGILHHIVPLLTFVALFAIIGGYFIFRSYAATTIPELLNGRGVCLTDPGGSTAAEVSMGVASCNGSTAEQWKLTGGKIENTALSGTHCIEPLAGSMKINAAVVMDTCNTSAHQDWTSGTDGELKNSSSGYCLTIPGGNTAKALTVVTCQPATYSQQRWTATYVSVSTAPTPPKSPAPTPAPTPVTLKDLEDDAPQACYGHTYTTANGSSAIVCVGALQVMLNEEQSIGNIGGSGIALDGEYGSATSSQVTRFQTYVNSRIESSTLSAKAKTQDKISVDGEAGPQTWSYLCFANEGDSKGSEPGTAWTFACQGAPTPAYTKI